SWKRSALLILERFVDHRGGNMFLRTVKDPVYQEAIKEPMSLDIIKSRIREGVE
ncbi:hypothetical protein EDD86DRAFT_182561, partial [Gorgonomyces haynaldii]